MKMKSFIFILSFFFMVSCNTTKKSVNHGWLTNLEEGLSIAKKEKKAVFTLITGSDWCPPCKNLEREILETEEFKKFSSENLVLVKLDFPKRPANRLSAEQSNYNKKIKKELKASGFPTVILLNRKGEELNRWRGYRSTPLEAMLDKYRSSIK